MLAKTPRAILQGAIVATINGDDLRQLLAGGVPSRNFDALAGRAFTSSRLRLRLLTLPRSPKPTGGSRSLRRRPVIIEWASTRQVDGVISRT